MTPDQLITFSVVAHHLNISHAARQLHLSQPAVSGQLQALQQSFGEALYHRHGRGIQLTPAGQALREVADRIRLSMQAAFELKRASRDLDVGLLRLGASTTPASYLLPEYVAAFKRAYPGIVVQMLTGNSQQVLERNHELDLVFVEGELNAELSAQHDVIDWRQDEVVAIVPHRHPLAQNDRIPLSALASESLVLREQGSGVRNMILQAFAETQVPLPDSLELAGVEGIKQGVRAGLGVGFVSNLSLSHEDGSLVGVHLVPAMTRMIRIVVPRQRTLAQAAQRFLSWVQTHTDAQGHLNR